MVQKKPSQRPTLRIGFIGAGGIADLQVRTLLQRNDVEIVAVSDVSDVVRERRAGEIDNLSVYADHRKMLQTEQLDAVTVCTPNSHHAKPTVDALKSGCHVLVEKPICMTLTEGRRMLSAAAQAKRKLIIGFQYRFDPRTQFLRAAFDDGHFGNILYGRIQAMRRRGIPNWGVFGRKELQGGGPLIDIGVHVLEMAHYTMGSPTPVSACADMFTYLGNKPSDRIQSAWAGWDHKTYNVEDLAVGRIRFDNGAVLHIESAFAAHIGEQSIMNFQLLGDQGGATWEPATLFTDEAGHMIDKQPGWLAATDFDKVFARKMHGFVEHVLDNQPTIAPAYDGFVVQAMLDAMYRSAERGGKEVRINVSA